MKGVIALVVVAGLLLTGVPVLATELGHVEGLKLADEPAGLYLGGDSDARHTDIASRNMDDINYIWPDVRDTRAVEATTEPEVRK
jgi:hypothetical protein